MNITTSMFEFIVHILMNTDLLGIGGYFLDLLFIQVLCCMLLQFDYSMQGKNKFKIFHGINLKNRWRIGGEQVEMREREE